MNKKIPFAPPRIDEATIAEVTDALRSGWITTGPKTKALEKETASLAGVDTVLCVNSATAGMQLMLWYYGIGPGDEVIVPAYTYCATANVVLHCRATPVMVDVNPADGCIDPEAVRRAMSPKTKAIIPVDLAGLPVDYGALWEILNDPDIRQQFQPANERQEQLGRPLLLADAAHSLGAIYGDKPAATQSDATVFSFHAVKNLTTAEGGAICLNLPKPFDNAVIYKLLNTASLHGQSKDALAKFGGSSWEYDVAFPGFKCNLPDVLAAIGLVEARRYAEDTLPRRREICAGYANLLSDDPRLELPVLSDDKRQSSAHLFLLRIKDISREVRDRIIERIFAAGVSVNVHYKPLPMLSAYAERGYDATHFPHALDLFERMITLPVFYDLQPEQQQRVAEVVSAAVKAELL